MDARSVKKLLAQVKSGELSVDAATHQLKDLPFAELGYATVDTHRSLRVGVPEVILGEPKTVEQLLGIVRVLDERRQAVLVTRVKSDQATALVDAFPHGTFHKLARLFEIRRKKPRAGVVSVVSAGTGDLPVAEEAALTAEALGATVHRVYDVGVAGLHRLLRKRELIQKAHAVVAVAGMEGALASVVGGLVGVPVVAVPTSVGYGANLQGVAAMLGMINACASNIAVVNIDNGFAGGYYAALVSRTKGRA